MWQVKLHLKLDADHEVCDSNDVSMKFSSMSFDSKPVNNFQSSLQMSGVAVFRVGLESRRSIDELGSVCYVSLISFAGSFLAPGLASTCSSKKSYQCIFLPGQSVYYSDGAESTSFRVENLRWIFIDFALS